jgi:SPP1 family predicted phage head-tail adaptor
MNTQAKYHKAERIGRMAERMQVHFATTTTNEYGERVQAWQALGTFWTAVTYLPLRSKEGEAAWQETVMTSVNFTLRDTAITETMRVYYRQRLYDIEALSRSDDRQYLTLSCKQYEAAALATPDGEGAVGSDLYLQTFTGLTTNTVTVTVYGGNLPTSKAKIWLDLNGQTLHDYTVSGAVITLPFELMDTDTLTVRFAP